MPETATREEFERFHAGIDDAYLDAIARTAGCDPPIGRLNFLDDVTLRRIVDAVGLPQRARVLDLGCGRGFAGRWLASRGARVDYTGIDSSAAALAALGRHLPGANAVLGDLRDAQGGPFDAIFAIESFWAIDGDLAARVFGLLHAAGTFVSTVGSCDGSQARRVELTLASLAAAGFETHRLAVSENHAECVGRLSAAALIEPQSDDWIRAVVRGESARTLAALREGAFRYDVFVSRKT
jgi:SAM-dependent methyltransferase